MYCRIVSNVSDLYPLAAYSTSHLPPHCDNQKGLQTLPAVPCGEPLPSMKVGSHEGLAARGGWRVGRGADVPSVLSLTPPGTDSDNFQTNGAKCDPMMGSL